MKLWAKRCGWFVLGMLLLAGAGAGVLVRTGALSRGLRRVILRQLETATGASAQLGAFHFQWHGLRAELDDLTLRGKEPAGAPPLFHADRVIIRLRIVSLLGRRIALEELRLDAPQIVIRVDSHGHSNVPAPKAPSTSSPLRRLFDLEVGSLEIFQGRASYNDVRVPFALEASDLRFAMSYAASGAEPAYAGEFAAAQLRLSARDYRPFGSGISGKFVLTPSSFSLDELRWKVMHSSFELHAGVSSFARPEWSCQGRGRAELSDVAAIFHAPETPPGTVEFTALGRCGPGHMDAEGHFSARDVRLPYTWFHTAGIAGEGRFHATDTELDIPAFAIRILGGSLTGKFALLYRDLQFRVDSHGRGASLPALLAAIDNKNFPLHTFHWEGSVAVDAVNTWNGSFRHFRTRGETQWSAASRPTLPGALPVSARINFLYSMDQRQLTINSSSLQTPDTTLQMDGTLGAADSDLETNLTTRRLADFEDFINFLRGPGASSEFVAGELQWKGRVLGPLAGPTFSGVGDLRDARYGSLLWDEVAGHLEYSPDGLKLTEGTLRREDSTMLVNLSLELDGSWGFLPASDWSLGIIAARSPLAWIEQLFGVSYPVGGLLSGNFHAGGTRADPCVAGSFRVDRIDAKGWRFDRFEGTMDYREGVLRLSKAELATGSAAVSGALVYHTDDKQLQIALHGAGIPFQKTFQIASTAIPVSFRLSLEMEARGPLEAPRGKGTIRLEKLQIGDDDQGNFTAQISSDGQRLEAQMNSEGSDRFQARAVVTLTHDFPISAHAVLSQLTLNTLVETILHQPTLVGHARADGIFTVAGPLAHPSELTSTVEFTRLAFIYSRVHLENSGPVKFGYHAGQLSVGQANFHGPNSDFHIAGYAQFTGERSVGLRLDGQMDLQLANGLASGLDARGKAQVDASVGGRLDGVRVTGKLHVTGGSAHYGELPIGLSNVNGDFVFNRDRMLFNGVTAEAGGGNLTLSGSLIYSMGHPRYDIQCAAASVRVRYPPGLSWLGDATLRLSGDTQGGVLSGSVSVDRLLLTGGADLFTLAAATSGAPSAPSSSAWVRNLQLNIAVGTVAGAQFKSAGAHLDLDGAMNVRGTADHPVLLGNVHISDGTITFRGTDYSISRGDVNFANPFRLDPVLNIEATTTIQQYLITLDFSGPSSHLSLAYRSDPPLGSGDIIALLALGTTGGENALRSSTSGSQTQGFGATALLSEAISSELGGRIEKLFGISRFRVDPFLAGTTTEQNAAARVTIEQQVTHDLTVTYSTNATSNQQQVIEVDYAVNRNISIVALRDIDGTFGIDIKFTKRFK